MAHTEAQVRRYNQRYIKPLMRLCEKAKVSPDSGKTPEQISDRTARFGRRVSVAEVRRIIDLYEQKPHMCVVLVDHTFNGRGCSLGVRHQGCCPGCPGEEPETW